MLLIDLNCPNRDLRRLILGFLGLSGIDDARSMLASISHAGTLDKLVEVRIADFSNEPASGPYQLLKVADLKHLRKRLSPELAIYRLPPKSTFRLPEAQKAPSDTPANTFNVLEVEEVADEVQVTLQDMSRNYSDEEIVAGSPKF